MTQLPNFLNEYLNTYRFNSSWEIKTGFVLKFDSDYICGLQGDYQSSYCEHFIKKCILLFKLSLLEGEYE